MLPAARAGPTFQLAIGSGKFHGVISPTTPSGSRKVTSTPPAYGDLRAEQPLWGAGVVVEHVDDAPDLAAGIGDRLADVARLELRELLDLSLEHARETAQKLGAIARADVAPGGERCFRARDRLVGFLRPARGSSARTCSVAGSKTCMVSVLTAILASLSPA